MGKIILFLFFTLSINFKAIASENLIKNFDAVINNVYRGSRLSDHEDRFRFLSGLGVNIVVNLEYFHGEEPYLCSKYDFDCIKFPILLLPLENADLNFDYHMLVKTFGFVIDKLKKGKQVYIHCYHGSDRTGALSAALKIREAACGNDYNKRELYEYIKEDLETHGFHSSLYHSMEFNILSWTQKIPKWICR